MNRRAKGSTVLLDNAIFLILLVLFVATMTAFIFEKRSGASFYEEFYSEEIARIINDAEPGDVIALNVQRTTEIAASNDIGNDDIFVFDNEDDRVGVRLGVRTTYFNYFNDVEIADVEIEQGVPVNLLKFKVVGGEASA